MKEQHTIMVVDDEIIVSMQLEKHLTALGYKLGGKASSAEEAVKVARHLRPDLILMDIVMPGKLDGIDAAEIIQSELGIPVIFTTAYVDDMLIKRAKDVEPFGYILKPIQDTELKAAIEISLYKKEMERKLRESEKKYRALMEDASDAILLTDTAGNLLEVNKRAEKLLGYGKGELLQMHFQKICPAEVAKTIMAVFKATVKKGLGSLTDIPVLKKMGKTVPVQMTLRVIEYTGKKVVQVVLRDITEIRQTLRVLQKSREQLRNLSVHLETIREEERKNIAREIHDELGQCLTALKMDTSWLMRKLPKNSESLYKKAELMLELIDSTIKTVKKISSDLRPPLLDDLGLPAAIEWQEEEFEDTTGISCETAIEPPDISIDQERSITIFRILQEALTNAARHSAATRVKVNLEVKNGCAVLTVIDNGRGITEEQISDPNSFGLLGISERAYFWGGEISIKSKKGKGTTLTARIPLENMNMKKRMKGHTYDQTSYRR